MSLRAVVFEVFGTLLPVADDRELVAEMARVLSAPPFEFAQVWRGIVTRRETDGGGTVEDDVNDALRVLNAFTHLDQRRSATNLAYGFTRRSLEPPVRALETLTWLRAAGLRTAVVANATPLLARLWSESPLAAFVDRTAWSCEAGGRLPDAGLYRFAAERLGVSEDSCVAVVSAESRSILEPAGWRVLAADIPEDIVKAVQQMQEG